MGGGHGGDRQNKGYKDWKAQDWSASESLGNLGQGLIPEDSGAFSESTLGLWEVCLGQGLLSPGCP